MTVRRHNHQYHLNLEARSPQAMHPGCARNRIGSCDRIFLAHHAMANSDHSRPRVCLTILGCIFSVIHSARASALLPSDHTAIPPSVLVSRETVYLARSKRTISPPARTDRG